MNSTSGPISTLGNTTSSGALLPRLTSIICLRTAAYVNECIALLAPLEKLPEL